MIALIDKGNSPSYFRLVNILLHALNGFLFFKVAELFWSRQKLQSIEVKWLCWTAVLIYLLHPIQVESVVWISSMRTLLATSFSLLSVGFLLKNEFNEEADNWSLSQCLTMQAPALLFYFMGMLTNPAVAPTLLFASLLIIMTKGRMSRGLTLTLLAALICALLLLITHQSDIVTTYYDGLSLLLRFKISLISLSTYFINLLLPFKLAFDYQVNAFNISYLEETSNIAPMLFLSPLVLLTCIALFLKENLKRFGQLLLGFIILIFPHIGIVLHDFNNISVVSDRYLNLPLIAFSMFLSYLLMCFMNWVGPYFKKIPLAVIPAFIFLLLPTLTIIQIAKWEDPKIILKASQTLLELRAPMLIAIGNQYASEQNFTQARAAFKEALAAEPDSSAALLSLMHVNDLSPLKDEDHFVADYINSSKPSLDIDLYIPLAKVMLKLHRFKEAIILVDKSIKQNFELEKTLELKNQIETFKEKYAYDALSDLESYYASKGFYVEALGYLNQMLKARPENIALLERQKAYLKQTGQSK